jgi:hypothetical protein
MGEYRERKTGEVKSQGDWRFDFKNMSLPKIWNSSVCDALNIDPVLEGATPTTTAYQTVVQDGVEQNSNNIWVKKYVAKDMFADIEGGKTKSEQEAEYQAILDANTAAGHRSTRDSKLAETDWTAMSDVTMADNMKTYRQALRDLPTHKNWPNLEDADWPTKP